MTSAPEGPDKAAGAFRTIGEVEQALGIKQHVLRYWEEQFPMLSPVKRSGNRRYYRTQDVEIIALIDRLVNTQGYTLRGARLAIEAQRHGASGQTAMPAGSGESPGQRHEENAWLSEMKALREVLMAALDG